MNTLRTRKACKDIDLELIQVYADSALENSIKMHSIYLYFELKYENI